MIWLQFLLFLRTTDTYSPLIHMIMRVAIDMSQFLLIFMIGVIAFADAFLSIEQALRFKGYLEVDEDSQSENLNVY